VQNYSEKFKSEMVKKLVGPSKMSAFRLSKECGVGQPTLSRWLRDAKVASVKEKPMGRARKRWSPEEKKRVVLAATAAGEAGDQSLAWMDSRPPVLDGRAPRECLRTAHGRARLKEALLRSP
jgi:transposase-like protein